MQQQEFKKPSQTKLTLTVLLILVLLGASVYKTDASLTKLITGFPEMGKLLIEMFPPDLSYFDVIWKPLLETVQMAIIGTTIGAILAVPVAFFAAKNVARSPFLYVPARFIMNLIRTIPDLLFAGIFVAIFGLGALAGTLSLGLFSFGIIAKLLYESIEAIDPGPLEAMTSVGANKIQWIHEGVVPQVSAHFMSYLLYTFEVNIRAASILGLVGAGGIGIYLDRTLNLFQYDKTATIIIGILFIVLIIDYVSNKIREQLL
jgi:phosphonate transport system permease protein